MDDAPVNDAPLLPAPEEPLLLTAPEEPLLLPAPKEPGGPQQQGQQKQAQQPKSRPASFRLYWIAAIVLVVLVVVGWFFHHLQADRAKEANADARDRLPRVGVVEVRASPANSDLLLPGSIVPITEASLFARSSGYLTQRFVDIGDTVTKGQVLAIVDSPDLDQQVAQGRAAVAQAKQQLGQAEASVRDARARLDLARITAERTDELGRDNAVAQQEVDQRRQERDTAGATVTMSLANVGAAEANVRASQANAGRLVVLQDFEKIRAPFDGIVTARNVDVGALIGTAGGSMASSGTPSSSSSEGAPMSGSSGSSGSSTTGSSASGTTSSASSGQAMELFRIGQVGRLRVFVSVPQENASAVEPDHDAKVFVAGYAEPFAGRVTRTARSLDPSARTLLTEVQIDNARRQLMPGMYAQVRFESARISPPLLVPGEAVIARAGGLSVAVIEDLRPDDRRRLPKTKPKEDSKKSDGDTKGGKQRDGKSSNGDDKDAKQAAKGKGDDAGSKGGDEDDGDAAQSDDPQDAKRIHLQPIKVGRDYGTQVEIIEGLAAGATIVANPGDDVAEDALVMPRKSKSAEGAPNPDDKGAPPTNPSPSMQAPTKGKK